MVNIINSFNIIVSSVAKTLQEYEQNEKIASEISRAPTHQEVFPLGRSDSSVNSRSNSNISGDSDIRNGRLQEEVAPATKIEQRGQAAAI